MKEHITIGLSGAGKIGRVHAMNLVSRIPNARLVAVSDVRLESAKKFDTDFAIQNVFDGLAALKTLKENRPVNVRLASGF